MLCGAKLQVFNIKDNVGLYNYHTVFKHHTYIMLKVGKQRLAYKVNFFNTYMTQNFTAPIQNGDLYVLLKDFYRYMYNRHENQIKLIKLMSSLTF